MRIYFQALVVIDWTIGCAEENSIPSEEIPKKGYIEERNPVSVKVLEEGNFLKQLVSNGKLHALKKSELSFQSDGVISTLPYKNGQLVKKGSIIAKLEQVEQQSTLDGAKIALKKSQLELEDFLIGLGYDLKDSIDIPQQLYETAKIRTGFSEASQQLTKAKEAFRNTILVAPFTGKLASLRAKLYEQPKGDEPFCILIDDTKFEVEFQLTETEIKEISDGLSIKVIPLASDNVYDGKITAINPLVDEHGLITIGAVVHNTGGLIEGMNVKVLVEHTIPNQLIVPKTAVIIRQNQDVLFKVVDGKAYWTYLQILYENSDSYAVIAHPEKQASLTVGDTVIIYGNLNLAHESEVVVEEY